jgi:hypothetical protein
MISVTCGQASTLSEACSCSADAARADQAEDRAFADVDVPAEDADAP